MPGKRICMAAGLKAQGPPQKTVRRGNDGPVVACARHWGSAAWIFEGLKHVEAGVEISYSAPMWKIAEVLPYTFSGMYLSTNAFIHTRKLKYT